MGSRSRGEEFLAALRSTHIAAVGERFLSGRCDRRGTNAKCEAYIRIYGNVNIVAFGTACMHVGLTDAPQSHCGVHVIRMILDCCCSTVIIRS
jgi:hypothetical protein